MEATEKYRLKFWKDSCTQEEIDSLDLSLPIVTWHQGKISKMFYNQKVRKITVKFIWFQGCDRLAAKVILWSIISIVESVLNASFPL